MRLPKPKAVDRQRRLFNADKLITSKGEARWVTGEFFENVIVSITGGVRLKTDSRCDICPDVKYNERVYFESKAVGRSGSVIFYESRVQKDADFMQQTGCRIVYWLWRHAYPVLKAQTYDTLWGGLASHTTCVVIAHAGLLHECIAQRGAARRVNSGCTADGKRLGYGQSSRGYGWGWTLPVSWFVARCRRLPISMCVGVGGHTIDGAGVYVSRPGFAGYVRLRETQGFLQF